MTILHVLRLTILILVLTLAGLVPATAQTPEPDDRVASLTSTVVEHSRTLERGERFDLYDRMHPDARNLFPRLAFFLWLDQGGLVEPVDDPTVLSVEFGPWTSPLTGETYDEAATVRYRQVVLQDGTETTVESTMMLVADGLRWRWFPDVQVSDIEQVQALVDATPDAASDLRRATWVRVDRFWAEMFDAAGWDYEPAAIVAVVEEPFPTGCGMETDIAKRSIYYCTLDETIYYDPEFEEDVVDMAGAYAITMVISHEWAHHIQWLLGIDFTTDPELHGGLYPVELELQADCLAGVYAQDALANGDIGWDQVDSAIEVTAAAGDRPGTDWDDWDAHGTREQRVESFQTGFDEGFWGCYLDMDGN